MLDALWVGERHQVWLAYTPDELPRLYRATRQNPLSTPIHGHPRTGAQVELSMCLIEAPGAPRVEWGEGPFGGTLYAVLDEARLRALTQLPSARHPLTGVPLGSFTLPIQGGGGTLAFTIYDDAWHKARGAKVKQVGEDAIREFRAANAERRHPGLSKVHSSWRLADDSPGAV